MFNVCSDVKMGTAAAVQQTYTQSMVYCVRLLWNVGAIHLLHISIGVSTLGVTVSGGVCIDNDSGRPMARYRGCEKEELF